MSTFLEKVESFSPTWLLEQFAEGFVGATLELVADAASETMSQSWLMSWLLEPTSPDDALPFVGSERRMPRYPGETLANYRLRLWDAWSAYAFGGSKKAIEDQLRIAGFPGRVLYGGPYQQSNYYSQFWIWFPQGTHTVTAPAAPWGSFNWGDGTLWGPSGITTEQLNALIDLVKKWKHSQWICRALVFEISGWSWGTGHVWGEPGLVWGGESAVIGVV
jgi:hypothetical protein